MNAYKSRNSIEVNLHISFPKLEGCEFLIEITNEGAGENMLKLCKQKDGERTTMPKDGMAIRF